MGRVSVGEAVAAGFKLIGREPAAFAVWCVLYLVIYLAPSVATLPAMLDMWGQMSAGLEMNEAAILEASNRVAAFQPLGFLSLLAILAIIPPAVFRAVLSPQDRGFFYLRVGMREFWVLIVTIVVAVIWVLAFLASMIPTFVIALAGGVLGGVAAGPQGGGMIMALLFGIAGYVLAIGLTVWVGLRFSMAPVMSFAENTFRVPESWRLTKGHAWRLFLVALALFAISTLAQLLLLGAGFAALAAGTPNFLQAMQTDPRAVFQSVGLPVFIVAGILLSLAGVAFYVIGAAAWANIYRQLKPPLAETFG